MELEAAKMIGAGLAAIALAGAGVGIGLIFGNYLSGGICISRSYWFIWVGSCINNFICVLIDKI